MTRILVQRGGGGSSSNPNRSSVAGSSSASTALQSVTPSTSRSEETETEGQDSNSLNESFGFDGQHEDKPMPKSDEFPAESCPNVSKELVFREKFVSGGDDDASVLMSELNGLQITEKFNLDDNEVPPDSVSLNSTRNSYPPPPPPPPPPPLVPLPKPVTADLGFKRTGSSGSNSLRVGSSTRTASRPNVSTRSPSVSRPSSPRSCGEAEGYNSADEQIPNFRPSYDDAEKERQFEVDIRRAKGFEVRRMLEDGNCLFRAVADQVYGDSEAYDLVKQMCIDYMERERDYFSEFITEGFASYCKRKRRDKVYGNNVEIQALSEMYNRPIHIYSYSTEPINIFQGSYNTDVPPIKLSYHHGNHYNSLVDPRRLNIGAGLGFSSLQGKNIDKHQVKAAIRAQQDQQIDNALLAEGRFYSDLELTEKEIERMVMETSRAEYLADQQPGFRGSSTSGAEPSSSGGRQLEGGPKVDEGRAMGEMVLSSSMQIVLSMGFSYLQVMEAYSIFGDDVDSMLCYLLEMGDGSPMLAGSLNRRHKGKATEER